MNIIVILLVVTFTFMTTYVYSFVFPRRKWKTQKGNRMYNYNEEYPSDCENITLEELEKTLYIVIWEKTEKADQLVSEMEKQGLRTVFIPEDELETIRLTTSEMPLVYKEEMLLESWMDIYAEMYPM